MEKIGRRREGKENKRKMEGKLQAEEGRKTSEKRRKDAEEEQERKTT
jgi:hypothetical protein